MLIESHSNGNKFQLEVTVDEPSDKPALKVANDYVSNVSKNTHIVSLFFCFIFR